MNALSEQSGTNFQDEALHKSKAGGTVEQAASVEAQASAFEASLEDEGEIPTGLSLVKTSAKLEHVILPQMVKDEIRDFIEDQNDYQIFLDGGIPPRNKMVLMGPPGNGKTQVTKAIANEMELPLYFVRYDMLQSTKQGETSKRLGELFRFVKSHRCILFFDEIDAIGKDRGESQDDGDMQRVVSNLLVQLDDVPPHVIVLGATNHPEMLDRAIWRRFHGRMLLPNPGNDELEAYTEMAFKKWGYEPELDLRILAITLEAENFAEVEVFVENCHRAFIRSKAKDDNPLSIEQAIQKAQDEWPRVRVKIPKA